MENSRKGMTWLVIIAVTCAVIATTFNVMALWKISLIKRAMVDYKITADHEIGLDIDTAIAVQKAEADARIGRAKVQVAEAEAKIAVVQKL